MAMDRRSAPWRNRLFPHLQAFQAVLGTGNGLMDQARQIKPLDAIILNNWHGKLPPVSLENQPAACSPENFARERWGGERNLTARG